MLFGSASNGTSFVTSPSSVNRWNGRDMSVTGRCIRAAISPALCAPPPINDMTADAWTTSPTSSRRRNCGSFLRTPRGEVTFSRTAVHKSRSSSCSSQYRGTPPQTPHAFRRSQDDISGKASFIHSNVSGLIGNISWALPYSGSDAFNTKPCIMRWEDPQIMILRPVSGSLSTTRCSTLVNASSCSTRYGNSSKTRTDPCGASALQRSMTALQFLHSATPKAGFSAVASCRNLEICAARSDRSAT